MCLYISNQFFIWYLCIVSLYIFAVTPNHFPFSARTSPSKPLFLSRLEPELSLENGEPLLLKCKASGYPPPKVTWYKDGTPLQSAAPYEISSSRSGETSLHIPETDEVDGGVYSCLASNPSGQDSTSCNVSVAGWFIHLWTIPFDLYSCWHHLGTKTTAMYLMQFI